MIDVEARSSLGLKCEAGILSRCSGSSKVTMGRTVVLAGVHGPNEARTSQQNFRNLVVDLRVSNVSSSAADRDKMSSIEKVICDCVNNMIMRCQYPRMAITLTLQVR